MKNSKGFKRLKGMASVSALGFAGLFGVGSGRAGGSTVSTGFNITTANATWVDFGNNSSFPSSSTMTTTNGDVYTSQSSPSAFCYSDGRVVEGTDNFGDAFDCAMLLAVDGSLFVNPDSSVDLTGTTVTSDVVNNIVPGIDAQIQYHAYTNRRLIRGLFTLTNSGPGPIFVNAAILGDYGSDNDTNTLTTSNNDTNIENADLWFITNDNDNGDPVITTTRYGVDAEVVPLNALTPSNSAPMVAVYGLRYPLDIPAGATVRIMTFHEMGPADDLLIPAQVAAAKDFESMTAVDAAGLIDDLDETVRASIVNYGDSDLIFKNGFE